MQTTIEIKASDYAIYIGDEVFANLSNFINQDSPSGIPTNVRSKAIPQGKSAWSKIFILVDENTSRHCLPSLIKENEMLKTAEIIEIKSGETNKNIETCSQIWERLSDSGADRKSLLINLGGGVITDIGGFSSSTYKRGIDFINIPTTLLSQVDASAGGKTGINLKNIKNQVGVFSNPKAVFIYPGFLKTLDKRQLLSGFSEVIKHGLIADTSYWDEIKSDKFVIFDPLSPVWKDIIARSVEIKNNIVLKDPKEKGERKVLNFGHTIGHALESYSLEKDTVPLLHGEAIAIGMICESYLSWKMLGLSRTELDDIVAFILLHYKPYPLETKADTKLIELMKHDKKNVTPHASPRQVGGWSLVRVKRDQINFTLLSQIGKPVINENCGVELIEEALKFYRKIAIG